MNLYSVLMISKRTLWLFWGYFCLFRSVYAFFYSVRFGSVRFGFQLPGANICNCYQPKLLQSIKTLILIKGNNFCAYIIHLHHLFAGYFRLFVLHFLFCFISHGNQTGGVDCMWIIQITNQNICTKTMRTISQKGIAA